MRNTKIYNVTIMRGYEIVKEIHTNNCLYAFKQIQRWYKDEYDNEYLDRLNDSLHITFVKNDKERDLDEIREVCWRNGHLSVK